MYFRKQLLYLLIQLLLIICGSTGFAQTSPSFAGELTTLAGNGLVAPGFAGDGGMAFNSLLNRPSGVAIDLAGNVYITDMLNNRIRKIVKSTGFIQTFAGTGTAGFSGDGGQALMAQINHPGDICVDQSGSNIYFVDSLNYRIRKINIATGIISTVAGNGSQGYAGQTVIATNAGIGGASGLAALYLSHLYISLGANGRICKLDLNTGMLSTFAGTGVAGFSGDGGQAGNAVFNYPAGLFLNSIEELYVADSYNQRIRKIDTAGVVTTVAGNGIAGFSGDGSLATSASLNFPQAVCIDDKGALLIADQRNHRIRKVLKASGLIYTVAGSGTPGFGGDGNIANTSCAKFFNPTSVRADAAGTLYIADLSNHCVRRVKNVVFVNIGSLLPLNPSDTTKICPGSSFIVYGYNTFFSSSSVNFHAIQFQVNGIDVPAIGSVLGTTLNTGDMVTAAFTFYTDCGQITIISDPVIILVLPVVTPGITIAASDTTICTPAAVTFTAAVVHGGTNPVYQWQVNGQNAGTNSAVFTSSTLANGDRITCILRSTERCRTEPAVTSNSVDIIANPTVTPAVSITANAINFCIGQTAVFNAVATNSGNSPVYQWKRNSTNVGTGSAAFSTSLLQDGDTISCTIMADTNLVCATSSSAISNKIVIRVANVAPTVTISVSENNICSGKAVIFTAVAQNAGNGVTYQWKVNGINSGPNNSVYSTAGLLNNDQVSCVITASNTSCSAVPISSNILIMSVKSPPVISITADSNRVRAGSQVKLTANVTGSVATYSWIPANLLIDPLTLSPVTKPLGAASTFLLSVTNSQGCTGTAQITIQVAGPLFMPSAFTPNNDGKNELFRIPPGSDLTLTDFSIYDRFGNKIFTTKDISKGWDGKRSGIALTSGVFVYNIQGITEGKKVMLKGSFVLIR